MAGSRNEHPIPSLLHPSSDGYTVPTLEHLIIAAPVRSSKTAIADVVRLMNLTVQIWILHCS